MTEKNRFAPEFRFRRLRQSAAVRLLVRGSEAWCESMMAKPDADWNDADTRLFAQKCLND